MNRMLVHCVLLAGACTPIAFVAPRTPTLAEVPHPPEPPTPISVQVSADQPAATVRVKRVGSTGLRLDRGRIGIAEAGGESGRARLVRSLLEHEHSGVVDLASAGSVQAEWRVDADGMSSSIRAPLASLLPYVPVLDIDALVYVTWHEVGTQTRQVASEMSYAPESLARYEAAREQYVAGLVVLREEAEGRVTGYRRVMETARAEYVENLPWWQRRPTREDAPSGYYADRTYERRVETAFRRADSSPNAGQLVASLREAPDASSSRVTGGFTLRAVRPADGTVLFESTVDGEAESRERLVEMLLDALYAELRS